MAMTMLTEKSDLINLRLSQGEEDEIEDPTHFSRRRQSVSKSINDVFADKKENEFALAMPENILSNLVEGTQFRVRGASMYKRSVLVDKES
jgi:hypothetical protein